VHHVRGLDRVVGLHLHHHVLQHGEHHLHELVQRRQPLLRAVLEVLDHAAQSQQRVDDAVGVAALHVLADVVDERGPRLREVKARNVGDGLGQERADARVLRHEQRLEAVLAAQHLVGGADHLDPLALGAVRSFPVLLHQVLERHGRGLADLARHAGLDCDLDEQLHGAGHRVQPRDGILGGLTCRVVVAECVQQDVVQAGHVHGYREGGAEGKAALGLMD